MRLSDFKEPQNEDIISKYNELKDLPQDKLSSMLFEEVAKQKREGTFDSASLYSTLAQMQNFLPAQTYENMKHLIESFDEKK